MPPTSHVNGALYNDFPQPGTSYWITKVDINNVQPQSLADR
jgi:hypothetical protein